ncbi:hypothetical protein CL634_03750 [bacterium]|nr:hypothetical protein [bacterium]|tara:strand:- start:14 stop:1015 length:1002 start_codon:yes stop_codon:yes gene_type:complete
MKNWLFEFDIDKWDEVEKREKQTNDKGEDVEVISKVKEKRPVKFALKKPNRRLYDKAELFYGVKMSEGIKAGLLTRSLLAKRYEDDGGAFSETEKRRYSELYLAIYNKENEYQRLQLNADNKPEELKQRLSQDSLQEIAELRRELQDIEASQANIFDQTAENRAKNQVIMWWVLHLSNWKEYNHNDYTEFFDGKNYDEKLNSYDEIEDSDEDFSAEAVRKLAYFVSFWYMGRASTQEDFEAVNEIYESNNPDEEEAEAASEEAAEETSEEKPKTKAKKPSKKKATKKKEKASAKEESTAEVVSEETQEPVAVAETDKNLGNTSSPKETEGNPS